MTRRRVAIIGLGMAVGPHARSLTDLADRVEVAAAFSRSPERAAAFAKEFPIPTTTDLRAIVEDKSITAALVLTPPWSHLDLVRKLAGAGKHILLEKPVEATTARAVELVETCRQAGITLAMMLQHRFRPASLRLTELCAAGGARPARRRLGRGAVVAAAELLRRARPRHPGARRRRRAADAGDPHARSLPQPDRRRQRGRRLRRHHAPPPHGGRGHRRRRVALRQRGDRHARCDDRELSRFSRAHRDRRREGDGGARRRRASTSSTRTDGARRSPGRRRPAAAPTRWRSATRRTAPPSPISSTPSTRGAPRVSGAAALAVHRLIEALLRSAREGRSVAVAG